MVPLLSLSMDILMERKEWNLTECHRLYLQLKASFHVIRFHVINVNKEFDRAVPKVVGKGLKIC